MADISIQQKIFNVSADTFESLALEIFRYQYQHNSVYRKFCELLDKQLEDIVDISNIPFLPIQFFKTHVIQTGDFMPDAIFESSGTTGTVPSKHFVKSLDLYENSFMHCFEYSIGNPADYCILALLPGYLERPNASLVYMADKLMKKSQHPFNGFYLNEFKALYELLLRLESEGQPTILLGVSFALLDFAEQFPIALKHTMVMETGGMKGKREEITKEAMHKILMNAFGVNQICSEYGMTELMSQAYSKGEGLYKSPPWMKLMVRAEDNPQILIKPAANKVLQGPINMIDLSNIHSCSFIATDDLGKIHSDGRFEIIGRIDYSDIRGCSQLVL